jgi:hypothetical protein
MLAELYLNMAGYPIKELSKYELAAKIAKNVIDSASYYGFGLLPDMIDLWKGKKQQNEETVLALHYQSGDKFSSFAENEYYLTYEFFNRSAGGVDGSLENMIPQVEVNFYNNFPKSYRKDVTFRTSVKLNDGSVKYLDTITYCTLKEYGLNTLIRKFYIYKDGDSAYLKKDISSDILYLFRYAHILLTYAEAKARAGTLDESAYEAVNMIRRRANKVSINSPSIFDLKYGLTTDQFIDSVVWERAWEFCAEPEGRWFDLMRLEMVEKSPQLRHPNEPGPPYDPITKDSYFIPLMEIN